MRTTRLRQVPPDALAELCRRYHISRLALFGSVLRPDFRPDSDIDVLVEFEPGQTPGLAFFDIEAELSQLLGRRVDLNTPQFLSPRIRARVQAEAEVLVGAQ
jgi:predicted nucleotidyltransferase